MDYPDRQRREVLDFLFKPKFGAALQHLKVEIGGGENSTCGSEPSHAVTREELAHPRARGYEFRFMSKARKRNPRILLDCLPWCYPGWISSRFSQDSADWYAAFFDVARKQYGLELDWAAAAQNEMGTDARWIVQTLRPTLDAKGYRNVRLQAPDNNFDNWSIFEWMKKHETLAKVVQAAGYHYPSGWLPKIEDDSHAAPPGPSKAVKPCGRARTSLTRAGLGQGPPFGPHDQQALHPRSDHQDGSLVSSRRHLSRPAVSETG